MTVLTVTGSISSNMMLTLVNAHTVFKEKMTELKEIYKRHQNDGDSFLMSWTQEFLSAIDRLKPQSIEEAVSILRDQLWLLREHVKSPHPPYGIIETPVLVCGVLWEKKDFDDYIFSYKNINFKEKDEILANVKPYPFCEEMIRWYRSLPLEPLNAIVPARRNQQTTNYSLTTVPESNHEDKIQLYHQFAIVNVQKLIIARQGTQIQQLAKACTQIAANAKRDVQGIVSRMEASNVLHWKTTSERQDKMEETQKRTHAIYTATLNDQNQRINHLNDVNQKQETEIKDLHNQVDSMQVTINNQAAHLQALADQSSGERSCTIL